MSDDASGPSVDELVEYCRTQARLLVGRVETMRADLAETLDELDDDIAEAKARLDDRAAAVEGTDAPQSTAGPSGADLDALEAIEDDLAAKQTVVEAEHARIGAFEDLAAGYLELVDDLDGVDDGREALERVVRFEADADAPAYFPDRQTVSEAAASDDRDG